MKKTIYRLIHDTMLVSGFLFWCLLAVTVLENALH